MEEKERRCYVSERNEILMEDCALSMFSSFVCPFFFGFFCFIQFHIGVFVFL